MKSSLRRQLSAPIANDSLAVFRILFGLLMAGGAIRFWALGWLDELFVRPSFFFKYTGFEWVPVWGPVGLRLHFAVLIIAALAMSAGLFFRLSALVFGLSFFLVQLMDQSNYLNHYYLVLWLTLLLAISPANQRWALDAIRRPKSSKRESPAWVLLTLRAQVAMVYIFAAVAKVEVDWLIYGQPMGIWLSARDGLPLLGPLFAQPWAPLAMSWAGFLYDASIVPLLLWRRTRILAYGLVLVFHGLTHVLFDIGLFPMIMVISSTLFLPPTWPSLLWAKLRFLRKSKGVERDLQSAPPKEEKQGVSERSFTSLIPRWGVALIGLWFILQLTLPLRSLWLPGEVLWGEQGMRYSWRVMVREKMGDISYRVRRLRDQRVFFVNPSSYLEPRQLSEMSGQPDMIAQLAHHIKDDLRRRGHGETSIYVDAWVSLNGRAPRRLIDPEVDLTGDLGGDAWILAAPRERPLQRPNAWTLASWWEEDSE
ncbi:MAG: HTTM domain-containing protein [Myxococcota bacterium]|nr:HTTM domain-containing protein [Myxococcota bacterium]